jgi:GR25 family glycosyltransferase involved in LPS biosynthesis
MNYISLDSYKLFISPSETVLFYSEENSEIEEFNELISSKENYVKDVDKNIITSFTTMLKNINSFYNPDTFIKITYPVYYINMDKNPDRKEFMENQLKKYATSFTRIRGFNGYAITNLKKDIVDNIEFTCDYDNMTKGEIGCTMSHLLFIKKAYDNGNEYALVVEDDVQLNLLPILDVTIKELVENAPNDWEIIKLFCGRNPHKNNKPVKEYKKFTYFTEDSVNYPTWGTVSYIINKKGMKKIIDYTYIVKEQPSFHIRKENNSPETGAADWIIYHIAKTYTIQPCIFYPNNILLESTIHDQNTRNHIKRANNIITYHYTTSSKTSTSSLSD